MRKKILAATLLLICSLSAQPIMATEATQIPQAENTAPVQQAPQPEVLAESAILIEADTGVVLYAKNIHEQLEPASITKIMTVMLALEHSQPNEIVTFSRFSVMGIEAGSSIIGMREGEEILMSDALLAIMLMSANEVAAAVAEHVSGSVEAFADLMNQKAKELGCLNTHFVNPHGLPDDNHYTSAYDMALIMQAAVSNPDFVTIISTFKHQIPETNLVDEIRYLANNHSLFRHDTKYSYEGCIGGKTGYTMRAMHTLVTAAQRDGMTLIAVTLRDTKDGKYTDTVDLFNYGFENYHKITVFDKSDDIFPTKVTQLIGSEITTLGTIMARAAESVTAVLAKGITPQDLEQAADLPASLAPPVMEGDTVGTLRFLYEGQEVGAVDLLADRTVEEFIVAPLVLESPAAEETELVDVLAQEDDTEKIRQPISHLVPVMVGLTLLASIVGFLVYNFMKKRRGSASFYSYQFRKFK